MSRLSMLLVSSLLLVASCGGTTEAPPATPGNPATPATPAVPTPAPPTVEPAQPSEPPPDFAPPADPVGGDACRADADCVLSTAPACCGCCQCAPLYATTVAAEQAQRDQCARVRCAQPNCAGVQCAPCGSTPPTTRAVCRAGACTVAR